MELDVAALPHLGGLGPPTHSSFVKRQFVLTNDDATVLVTHVGDNVEVRGPQLKLSFPVDDGGQRRAHQERTLAVTLGRGERGWVNE